MKKRVQMIEIRWIPLFKQKYIPLLFPYYQSVNKTFKWSLCESICKPVLLQCRLTPQLRLACRPHLIHSDTSWRFTAAFSNINNIHIFSLQDFIMQYDLLIYHCKFEFSRFFALRGNVLGLCFANGSHVHQVGDFSFCFAFRWQISKFVPKCPKKSTIAFHCA